MIFSSRSISFLSRVFTITLSASFLSTLALGQLDGVEKDRASQMLSNIKKEIEKNYYDPTFHGMKLDERFKTAGEKIKNATTLDSAFSIIAQALVDLNDSHTFFYPPERSVKIEYGWQMGIIGDTPYVIAVKPKSDAEKKGLKVGDTIISVNGFKPTRSEMWKMNYYYYQISPRAKMAIVVQGPGSESRQIEVVTKITQTKRITDLTDAFDLNSLIRESENESRSEVHRFQKVGNATIWRMPSFSFDADQVDSIMAERINGSRNLILDLRGNPGGYVKTMERLASYLFDKEVKIADVRRRKETEVSKTNPKKTTTFNGNIVILVDSGSASCSEILSRLIQIEKRGSVIGDKTAGAVMESQSVSMKMGTDRLVFYGICITDADVIMTDGKSLEHVGITPDELILPTGAEMAGSKDVALARALEKVGVAISPEDAGKLFPTIWKDN